MATARVQAILAREAATAVVFRCGPANKTAVIGWDLKTDTFKVWQWFCGSFYGYRSDLSPDGKHLIYFAGWTLQRLLRNGLFLQKCFLVGTGEGHGIYWERHKVCDEKGEVVVDGSNWGWADWDAPRKRIVFAEDGLICSLVLSDDRSRKVLFDCNALKYERRLAPY